MIRFSAGDTEIAGLVKFIRKRAPHAQISLMPLMPPIPDPRFAPPHPKDRRPRRTARPLLRRLSADARPTLWGVMTSLDPPPTGQPDENSCLILLLLGHAEPTGRRVGLLEARDEIGGDPPDLTPRARLARDLVERCARRIRRRGFAEKGRWHLPD
ncbi:MAG: hypothetical protein SFU56_16415 [Capsulimonadales bacterium]|nr:hypothetical protein [Capsulimonadales bacterium]